jgi:hypothetical protein
MIYSIRTCGRCPFARSNTTPVIDITICVGPDGLPIQNALLRKAVVNCYTSVAVDEPTEPEKAPRSDQYV